MTGVPLANQPRYALATLPTPLQELPRLREALGGPERCPRILIKRDDLTGLAMGGNKARKLEFLLGAALASEATYLITSGAVQSNHARMTAAAARAAGLGVALVLTSESDRPPLEGNLLLDRLLGAELHFIPPNADRAIATGDQEAAKVAEVAEALRQRGERPYVIPVGGSSAVGAFGYVTGTLEMAKQLTESRQAPSYLYYASGSRGTQAGLALGARLYSVPYRLQGIAVSGGEPEKTERALRIANEGAALLGVKTRVDRDDLLTDQGYIGAGYGIPTAGSMEAIHLLAGTEGIFLDPVYTAKAMAGMIDHIRQGRIAAGETVLFLHTGGTPALFAHADDFRPKSSRARLEGSQPILRVEKMETALKFYCGQLGFENAGWGTDEFTGINRDGAGIYLCRGGQGRGAAWIWIGVDNVEQLHDEYRAKGVAIRMAPTNYPWALEMQVEDPDGNVIRFGSERK